MGYIHSVVFCPELAKPRYLDKDDYAERSIVQLRNKFKSDFHRINEHVAQKQGHENIEWFEKKYKISILNFGKKMNKNKSRDSDDSSEDS